LPWQQQQQQDEERQESVVVRCYRLQTRRRRASDVTGFRGAQRRQHPAGGQQVR